MNYYDSRQPQHYGYGPPPQYMITQYQKPIRKWANTIGIGLLMTQVITFVIYTLTDWAFSNPALYGIGVEMWDLIDQSGYLAAYIVGLWLSTLFIVSRIKIPVAVAFPIKPVRPSYAIPAVGVCLGASMLGGYVSGILSTIIESLFGVMPVSPDFSLPQGVAANVVYCISIVVAPAVFEELLFRGVILQSLRRFGDGFAIVVSAILFGMLHGNLVQSPGTFILGLVAGYFVVRTGSLLIGMCFHFINNGMVVALYYVMEYGTEAAAGLLNAGISAGFILAGLAGLIFILVRYGSVFRPAPSDYPLPSSKKYSAFFLTAAQIIFMILTLVYFILYLE